MRMTYIILSHKLLLGATKHIPLPTDEAAPAQTDVSLITGNLRTLGTRDDTELRGDAKAVVARDNMTIATAHADAGRLTSTELQQVQFSWKGLGWTGYLVWMRVCNLSLETHTHL